MYKNQKLTEKQIDNENIIKNKDIISSFNGIRLINNEEKERFIKQKKLKNARKMMIGVSIFMGYIAVAFFHNLLLPVIKKGLSIGEQIACIVLVMGPTIMVKLSYKEQKRIKILIKKILKGNMYMAECYSYDKKYVSDVEYSSYYIKVTDNNQHYINKWLDIPCKDYDSMKDGNILKAKLFVLEDEPENQLFVVAPSEEK